MRIRLFLLFFSALLPVFFLSAGISANTTSLWTQAGVERFYTGKFSGTALTQDGRITLGYKMEQTLKSTEPYFWSLAYDKNGTLWAGTGNKAILYKIKNDGTAVEAAVLPGTGISALAADSSNNIYAAVMPGGKIFRIDASGARSEFIGMPATYVWDMKFDSKDNLFCVTGLPAGAFKITPDKQLISLYSSAESHFLSMFLDGKGSLYAGTSPNGLIVRVNIAVAEKMTKPASPPDGFGQWRNNPGRLSGDAGGLPTPEGDQLEKTFDDSAEANGASEELSSDPESSPDPRATVLLDMEEDEVYRLLPLKNGSFLAAANRNQQGPLQPQPNAPRVPPRSEPLSFPISQSPSQAQPGKIDIPSRLYLISPGGSSRLLLEIPDPYILSLHSSSDNDVLIGAGNEGRIYSLNVETGKAMLQSIPAKQVLSIVGRENTLRIATGNPGGVFAKKSSPVEYGEFTSSVNDASTSASYGNLNAVAISPGNSSIMFSARSGNTSDPTDGTWSAWSEPQSAIPFKISNPPGRYLQYKAILKPASSGESPALNEVNIYYITDNQPPEISDITVSPQPDTRPAPNSAQQGSRPPTQAPPAPSNSKGMVSSQPPQNNLEKNLVVGTVAVSSEIVFRWTASDPDSDTLKYTLDFRKLPSSTWVSIEEKIYGNDYRWLTDSLPDGTYEAKLSTSDIDSNSPERALSDEIISEPFIIDHTRPEIKIDLIKQKPDGGMLISLVVSDPTSIISGVEYSVNDLEWSMAFPADLIFDSTQEKIIINLAPLPEKESALLIRAKDYVGNMGSVAIPVKNK